MKTNYFDIENIEELRYYKGYYYFYGFTSEGWYCFGRSRSEKPNLLFNREQHRYNYALYGGKEYSFSVEEPSSLVVELKTIEDAGKLLTLFIIKEDCAIIKNAPLFFETLISFCEK